MKLLAALNTILPYLQAPAATSTTDRSPTVQAVLRGLGVERTTLLSKEYWFNSRRTELGTTPEGKIETPSGVLALYPEGTYDNIEVRGEYLYNLTDSTFQFDAPLKVRLVEDLPFEELPEAAASAVQWAAAIGAYVPDWGMDDSARYMAARLLEATTALDREHLRKRKYTSYNTPAAAAIVNALRS